MRFDDSKHLARSVLEILSNDSLFMRIRKRAYEYGRSMTWPKIGQAYWDLFEARSPSIPVILRPTVSSADWETPTYNWQDPVLKTARKIKDQQIYKSA